MVNILKSVFAKKEPIIIGHITPLTGFASAYGSRELEGTDLAAEEINKKGGINGRKIVIAREDDKADPEQSVEALNRLIYGQKVQAVVGPIGSSLVVAATPVANKNKVVLLSGGAASSKITSVPDYVFRIFPSTIQEGEKLINVAVQLGHKNASIIFINNEFGLDLAKAVKHEADAAGIEILSMEGYKEDATDFRDQLARIKEKNPNAIFLLGYPKDTGIILKQIQETGIRAELLAPDIIEDPSVVAAAGKAAEGIIYVLPDDKFSAEFTESYKKKFNKEPNIINALSYDSLKLLAMAIERGGYDGTAIKDELYKITDYSGATGNISFNENGDAINRPLTIKTIEEGKSIPFKK